MINNRQAGRRRGRGNTNGNAPRQGSGQGRGGDSGNRIDNRARGNAAQLYEKYKNLASDAQRQGDRVNIEYYLQFADHYFRVLNDQRVRQEENQPRRQYQANDGDDDMHGDDDFGAEGDPIRPGEQDGQRRDHGRRPDQYQRSDAPSDRSRDDEQDDDRGNRQPAPMTADSDEDDRPARRNGRVAHDRDTAQSDASAPVGADEQPKRRGRPRRDRSAEEAQPAAALDADRLPPSLGATSDAGDERPRRRRTRAASNDESTPAA